MHGRLYAWSPYAGRSQWYRNLLAQPVVTVQTAQGARSARAVPVRDDDEVRELYALLERFDAGQMDGYLRGLGIAHTADQVAAHKVRLHLVRLDPSTDPGPPPQTADLAWVWLLLPAAVATARVRRRRRAGTARRACAR